jgi:two-component system chemotaxis response regulator CheB
MPGPSLEPVRVLVVDDDPTYRLILKKTLAAIPGVEIVGAAADGVGAWALLEGSAAVDLVTLDVVLGAESGLDLLPRIQARFPSMHVVVLTSSVAREAVRAVGALLLGAGALVLKPSGPGAAEELRSALGREVAACRQRKSAPPYAAQVRRKPIPGAGAMAPRPASSALPVTPSQREVIAVGASTGGPTVLREFLKGLGPSFDVPVLVVQHMPKLHVPYFAELLARESERDVCLAVHGEAVLPGRVYVACDGRHLELAVDSGQLVLRQHDGPEEHNCRPAVDPLFRSVAAVCGRSAVGVVMTGMGEDGAAGARALVEKGAPVVAQDRESSTVWGMPGAVVAAGAASAVAPRHLLANVVNSWTLGRKAR